MRKAAAGLKRRMADRDNQIDVLTAALVGAALGVAATMLLRPSPRIFNAEPALKAARRGVRRARAKGEELLEAMPDKEDVAEKFRDYVETARDTIDRVVDNELRALRKRIRRERSRLKL